MREKAEKKRTATYDRRWRPEEGANSARNPADVQPVVRLENAFGRRYEMDGLGQRRNLYSQRSTRRSDYRPRRRHADLQSSALSWTTMGMYPRYPWVTTM